MIYGKVWGSTESLLVTPMIEIHRIKVNAGYKCSEHLHRTKYNAFYCIDGEIDICVRKNDYDLIDTTTIISGDLTTVPPGEYHWFETKDSECEVLEIYYPQHISEDIVRKTVGGIL